MTKGHQWVSILFLSIWYPLQRYISPLGEVDSFSATMADSYYREVLYLSLTKISFSFHLASLYPLNAEKAILPARTYQEVENKFLSSTAVKGWFQSTSVLVSTISLWSLQPSIEKSSKLLCHGFAQLKFGVVSEDINSQYPFPRLTSLAFLNFVWKVPFQPDYTLLPWARFHLGARVRSTSRLYSLLIVSFINH